MKSRLLITLAVTMLLVGCTTVYTGIVTITSVVDTGMKAWADVSAHGLSTTAVDAKVIAVHNQYRASCAVAQKALQAYKDTGDQTAYQQAYAVVRATAADLIALITPLIDQTKAAQLHTNLAKATTI